MSAITPFAPVPLNAERIASKLPSKPTPSGPLVKGRITVVPFVAELRMSCSPSLTLKKVGDCRSASPKIEPLIPSDVIRE